MSSAGVNLALLVIKAMKMHSEQDGCPWKDGAEDEAILSPEFSAFERKLKSLEICKAAD